VQPLLVVDAANVVGSVPDGWWRDRAGAAARLRDALQGRDEEVVLVVEGKARNVSSVDGVRVVAAEGSGDDKIVEVVASEGAGRSVTVVTADRALRQRVMALGADVAGPTSVPRR
jgi:hypothetical protein